MVAAKAGPQPCGSLKGCSDESGPNKPGGHVSKVRWSGQNARQGTGKPVAEPWRGPGAAGVY